MFVPSFRRRRVGKSARVSKKPSLGDEPLCASKNGVIDIIISSSSSSLFHHRRPHKKNHRFEPHTTTRRTPTPHTHTHRAMMMMTTTKTTKTTPLRGKSWVNESEIYLSSSSCKTSTSTMASDDAPFALSRFVVYVVVFNKA